MVPADRVDVLEAGMKALEDFARRSGARGRLITLYLGLRLMGSDLASLGSGAATRTRDIEDFMDSMMTKTHRPEPLVVLTAPFGRSRSPWSTRSGEIAPNNRYETNTWRNNFGIQKGVGCPAEPTVIEDLLRDPMLRLACPHMAVNSEGGNMCSLKGTEYRGEEQSIWLRETTEGWQGVDLDLPATYSMYLTPRGEQIPIFPLIAVLYCLASTDVYPERENVGIPDFAQDFGFTVDQVESIFNCDPTHLDNRALLGVTGEHLAIGALDPPGTTVEAEPQPGTQDPAPRKPAAPLPELPDPVLANSGLGAELAVAADLASRGWEVSYRGSQTGVGYDLEAEMAELVLCVEVKSSIGFTAPELSESEWKAACELGEQFVLAVVDFYGSPQQALWYVRNPAATSEVTERSVTAFRLARTGLFAQRTEADFL
jgi:hypothetical protein